MDPKDDDSGLLDELVLSGRTSEKAQRLFVSIQILLMTALTVKLEDGGTQT